VSGGCVNEIGRVEREVTSELDRIDVGISVVVVVVVVAAVVARCRRRRSRRRGSTAG